MVTTSANKIKSRQLPSAILAALTGDAAAHFDTHTDLVDKGFEMVALLCKADAPIGNLALFDSFDKLVELEMSHGEPLATYMSCIRTTVGLLCGGNIDLHPIL